MIFWDNMKRMWNYQLITTDKVERKFADRDKHMMHMREDFKAQVDEVKYLLIKRETNA